MSAYVKALSEVFLRALAAVCFARLGSKRGSRAASPPPAQPFQCSPEALVLQALAHPGDFCWLLSQSVVAVDGGRWSAWWSSGVGAAAQASCGQCVSVGRAYEHQ